MRLIRLSAVAVIAIASVSACAPAPTTTLTEFYGRNGGRSPNQPQAQTIPHCIDASDNRHSSPPRGRLC